MNMRSKTLSAALIVVLVPATLSGCATTEQNQQLNEAAIAEKHPSATSFNNIIHPHPERDFFCTLP
jgi:hypothetical protein